MVDRLKVITSRNFHALLTSVSSQNGSSNKRGNNGKIIGWLWIFFLLQWHWCIYFFVQV